jgi:hypothetical protein
VEGSNNSLSSGDRTLSTAPETDSGTVEGSCYSLCAGGRTLSTAPETDSRTLVENNDSLYSAHSSTAGTTQPAASAAPRIDSRVMKGSDYALFTGGRTPLTAPATNSGAVEGSCYSLCAGGRTLSTAPETDSRTLVENNDSLYSAHSSTAGTTQPAASAAPRIDSRVMEGSGYSLFTGGRTLLTAPVATLPTSPIDSAALAMDPRAMEKNCYPFSTGSRTLLTAQVASATPNTDSRALDGCFYPLSAGGRALPPVPVTDLFSVEGARKALNSSLSSTTGGTLPIAPIASVAPWMNSSPMDGGGHPVLIGGRSLATTSSAKANPLPLPLWCGQEFPNQGSVTSVVVYNDMLLN